MGTSVLKEITGLVNFEAPSKSAWLQALVDAAARLGDADRVSLILIDEKAREVRQFLRGGAGWAEVMSTVGYEELQHGLTGWALRTGETVVSPKDFPDPRESPEVQFRRRETRCGSVLVVPLGAGTGRFGTITAINRPDQPDFTGEEAEKFGVLAAFATEYVLAAEARDEAAAAVRSKTNFLSNLSHELRTPLNGILGFSHILADTPLDSYQKSMVATVIESGVRLLGTVDNILDLAQLEAGVYHLDRSPFSPRTVLEALAAKYRPLAIEKNLAFRVTSDAMLPAVLEGDAVKLGQAWGHILSNAVKFTDEGSIEVHLSSRTTAWDRHELVLQVKDTGIGLQEKQSGKWFRPFHQEDGSFTRKFGGTGLGLALCDRVVRKMGGGVSLMGEPGVGTSVRVWVVLGAEGSEECAGYQSRLRVLLLHSDPVGCLTLVKMMEKLGHGVDVVQTLEESGGRLASSPYEVVLVEVTDGTSALAPLFEAALSRGCHLVGLFPLGTDPATLPGEPWTACVVQPVGFHGLQAVLELCHPRREP